MLFYMFNLSDFGYYSNKVVKDVIDSFLNKLYSGMWIDLVLMKVYDYMFYLGQDRYKKLNVFLVLMDGVIVLELVLYSEMVFLFEVRCIIYVLRVIMIQLKSSF